MKTNKNKHILWSDWTLMSEEDQNALKADIKEQLLENYEENEITEDMIENDCITVNSQYFHDDFGEDGNWRYSNLKHTNVRVRGVLGLWYGDRECYKDFDNLSDAIMECLEDMNEIYEDRYGNLHINAYHHDGCNRFVIKKLVEGKERVLHFRKEVFGC